MSAKLFNKTSGSQNVRAVKDCGVKRLDCSGTVLVMVSLVMGVCYMYSRDVKTRRNTS